MTRETQRNHSPVFKAKAGLTALKDDKTMAELAVEFDVHPTKIKQWRNQLEDGVAAVFDDGAKVAKEPPVKAKCPNNVIDTTTARIRLGYSLR